jgi:hypothetical protein
MSTHSGFRDIINGFLSGSFTVFITQPLQVIRTSMMVTYMNGKPAGFIHIIKRIASEEGVKGFYRGFFPTLIKTPIGSAIFFSSLEKNKKILKNKKYFNQNTTLLNSTSSAIARTIQCTLLNPILVCITRFEVIGFNSYTNIFDALWKIKKEEGFKGYVVGLKPLLFKEVPTSAIFYTLYEKFKKMIKNFGINNIQIQASVSAITANIIITFLNNPLDVIRTRLQYLHFSKNTSHDYKGVFSGIYKIAKNEGVRGLTVGMLPRILKRASASAIAWTIYETLKLKGGKH